MASVEKETTDINNYHAIFTKLKKLHDISKTTNKPELCEESLGDDYKLASKRKTELDFDGLSDDSTLNSSINKTKRRRFSDSQDFSSNDFFLDDYRNIGKSKSKFAVTVSNLPGEWTYNEIKQYVTDECGVNVMGMIDSRCQKSDYQLRLRFNNRDQYKFILSKLKSKGEGNLKIQVEGETDSESEISDETVLIEKSEPPSCKSQLSEAGLENYLYGLNPEFLKSFNIEPPLVKWISVSNFRCDKSELRDLFEMAGRVVICVIIHSINKCAKIMYSHPLEAVQAISLLNGQIFYGQSLNVSLDPMADSAIPLPKGLQKFGTGLGQTGKPLHDVVAEYERFVNGAPSFINASLFGKSGEIPDDFDRYSPSKPSGSSGQFGAIGQKKLPAFQPTNSSNPLFSPPQSQYVPTQPSSLLMGIRHEKSSGMLVNTLASGSFGGMQSPSVGQKLTIQSGPPLNCPPIVQSRCLNTNMQNFPRPNYNQVTSVPGQYPPGPNYPGCNFQGQPGPSVQPVTNFQVSPNGAKIGQESPGHFDLRNPQIPPSFRPQGPFMQHGPIGPVPRMFPPVQNSGPKPNPIPVPPPDKPMAASPSRLASGPGLSSGHRSSQPVMVLKAKDPFTLHITNLPSQVGFANLCCKLSKVAQVVSLEFTTPGSALVKFSNSIEAERCFQYFSPSRFGHELGMV
ncbi:uncharacterized protein LOC111000901 [Pieris rapae]|uniref:uncharacterized protein LOC111000901 n=1 Tax=Pieris rapae TaxID=64459 RepID=UPI001E280CD2|nr:uncharacterized protein LOC111000901 [Pieris rapae]XP_022126197.2 uncharacterized protein LOC111000901 [Pieris rapae]